jgi:hypothetical protein
MFLLTSLHVIALHITGPTVYKESNTSRIVKISVLDRLQTWTSLLLERAVDRNVIRDFCVCSERVRECYIGEYFLLQKNLSELSNSDQYQMLSFK